MLPAIDETDENISVSDYGSLSNSYHNNGRDSDRQMN